MLTPRHALSCSGRVKFRKRPRARASALTDGVSTYGLFAEPAALKRQGGRALVATQPRRGMEGPPLKRARGGERELQLYGRDMVECIREAALPLKPADVTQRELDERYMASLEEALSRARSEHERCRKPAVPTPETAREPWWQGFVGCPGQYKECKTVSDVLWMRYDEENARYYRAKIRFDALREEHSRHTRAMEGKEYGEGSARALPQEPTVKAMMERAAQREGGREFLGC